MSIYLIDLDTMDIGFEFDCEQSEESTLNIDWPDFPIEQGQEVTAYGWDKPENFSVTGIVTAYPWDRGIDEQRPIKAYEALRAIAKKKQPITLVTKYWSPSIVLTSIKGQAGTGTGDHLSITVTAKTYYQPKVTYTNVPPSKLKKKVRRSGTPKKKTGSQPTKKGTKNKDKGQSALGKAFQRGRAASGV